MAGGGTQLANNDGYPGQLDGRVGDGAGAPIRIVWLGDSTAAGVGASSVEQTLPRQVASGLGRPVELTVLAKSGARITDVVNDQLPKVLALPPEKQPDVVLV